MREPARGASKRAIDKVEPRTYGGPSGIVCVSPKLPRAFLAQHSKRSAEHVGRRETMSVRSRRETVQAQPEGTLAVIHALGISLGITLWTRSGGRRVVEPPRA